MNVNSEKSPKRIRRSPEEAKALILKVAAARLSELGLEGLNIAGVAKAAGMSHATVIHHFGSTAAMRAALLDQMTRELLEDVVLALSHNEPRDKVLDRLFRTLSSGGHGRLLAWMAMERDSEFDPTSYSSGEMFRNIIDTITAETGDGQHARLLVYLVAVAAMGVSISGDSIGHLVGLSDEDRGAFPAWLADHIQQL